MKILYITQLFPFPADSGGKIKSYQTLQLLSQENDIYLICFSDSALEASYLKKVKDFCKSVQVVYRPEVTRRFKEIPLMIIKSIFSLKPFEILRYSSSQVTDYIFELLQREDIEAIHIDHLNMAQYLPKNKSQKWVLEEHNIESNLLKQAYKVSRFPLKIFYLWESIKFWLFEKKYWNKFDEILAISYIDKKNIVSRGINEKKIVVFPPVLKPNNRFSPKNKKVILFAGFLSWWPNSEGVYWFYDNVFHLIKKKVSKVEFWLVGKQATDRMKEIAKKDSKVKLLGYVRNIGEIYKKVLVLVVPIKGGSGIRMKILDGLSAGLPVVSTFFGVSGIDVIDGEEVLLADKPDKFADKVIRILTNKKLADQLSVKVLKFVADNYSEKKALQVLSLVYY